MSGMSIIPDLELWGNSNNYKNWQSLYLDIKTCASCRKKHGKIYSFNAKRYQPEHERCRCQIVPMRTVLVGNATNMGFNGADAWLMFRKILPDYYVTKEEAKALGYSRKKHNLSEILPGYMFGGDVFRNDQKKLPTAPGRIWREADLDYEFEKRSLRRFVYSNDGLIFMTNDHYQTFWEVVKEK